MNQGRGMKSPEEEDRGARGLVRDAHAPWGLVCAEHPFQGCIPWDSVLI